MAKYNKKRARELQHDKFRDTAGKIFDRVADRLEGKGKQIIYVLGGIIVVALLVGVFLKWSHRKSDEARRALGRGITIATTPLAGASQQPVPDTSTPTFANEQERAQKAIEEFQKVAAKYGDPYQTQARYFIATNLLYVDRQKGIAELQNLTNSKISDVAALSKFALAQAYAADQKYDEAARLYSELAKQNGTIVTAETANLALAEIYKKQGKKNEAADILFNIIEASRKAKDADGLPLPASSASRDAATMLQKIDPDRYAKLTPEAPSGDLPF